MSPRRLGTREVALLQLYAQCQWQMDPKTFYAKWDVTHAQIAMICGCSESTVDRWFSLTHPRLPDPMYLRRLAEMDFLWEYYEAIPPALRYHICRPPTRYD